MLNRQLNFLGFFVMAYLVAAFAWWAVLLLRQNDMVFESQKTTLLFTMAPAPTEVQQAKLAQLPSFIEAQKKHKRQRQMIFGEGLFFTISLGLGLLFIFRAQQRSIKLSGQQRNFMLSVTHELKSPLAGIQMGLETIQAKPMPPERLEQISKSALTETKRLSQLVGNLLLSNRMESGFTPFFEPLNVVELVQKATASIQKRFPAAKINIQSEANFTLQGDKNGLESIFHNLIENAILYGGTENEIKVSVIKEAQNLIFSVTDLGPGIPKTLKKLVFQKFYRIADERTRNHKGTGLGLYIVAQMVKAHKGSIQLENNHPKGSIFRAQLPLRQR